MATTCGNVTVSCPVCGRELSIPVVSAGPVILEESTLRIAIDLDREYLRAHALTHTTHDGEPEPVLAAVA